MGKIPESGIVNGQTIQADHILNITNALRGEAGYEIHLSGTLHLSSSVESDVIVSGNVKVRDNFELAGYSVDEISNDTSLGGSSTTALVTENAAKAYADNLIFIAASGSVLGSGSNAYVPLWEGSGTIGVSQIYDDTTNVGIGTVPSTYKLEVGGAVSASTFYGDGSNLTNITVTSASHAVRSDISDNAIDFSSSLASRATTNESSITSNTNNISTLNGKTLISSSEQISTDISGAFDEVSSSLASRITVNDTNISSNASDISNLQSDSGSFSTRLTTNESEIDDLQTDSGSFSTRVTTNESNISTLQSIEFLSSSAQIATDISGAFDEPSASIAADIVTNAGNISTNSNDISNLQTDSGSFSTRLTTNESEIDDLQTDSGSFSTRVTTLEGEVSTSYADFATSSSHAEFADVAESVLGSITSASFAENAFAYSQSFQSRNTTDESNLTTLSSSIEGRVTTLETTTTASFAVSASTSLNSVTASYALNAETAPGYWTGSDDYISRLGDVKISGSLFVQQTFEFTGSDGLIIGDLTITGTGSFGYIDGTIVSSSFAQNAFDYSSSFETRITTNASDIDTLEAIPFLSSSAQIATDISGAFVETSASIATGIAANAVNITSNTNDINTLNSAGLISSSAQISSEISGAFVETSASIAVDVAANVVSITTLEGRANSLENVSGSYATTGSNEFNGNQQVTGSFSVFGDNLAFELKVMEGTLLTSMSYAYTASDFIETIKYHDNADNLLYQTSFTYSADLCTNENHFRFGDSKTQSISYTYSASVVTGKEFV